MKNIYIDGLGLVEGHFSGVGQYILGILRGIDAILDDAMYKDEVLPNVIVIIPRDCVKKFNNFGFKHITYKQFPLPFRYMAALWHRGWLPPIDIWCGRGDYIFPRFVDMPLAFSKSAALVIFDLSYELHRQYSDERNAKFLSYGVNKSINRTKKVITISQNAKQEIINFYKLNPKKVVVATPAVDAAHFYKRSQSEIDTVKRKYKIDGDYILALSNLEPRKNLDGLVDAYCSLPKSITRDLGLLLVGVNGWKTEKLFDKIIGKVEEGFNISRPSHYVSDKDKPAIVSGAKLLVYPSHYEGFGLPPLEALACGIPVITASNSSLPEVVGDAAKLIKETDMDTIANAIIETLEDYDDIEKRARTSGPKQAEKFSWVSSAEVFLNSIKEIT